MRGDLLSKIHRLEVLCDKTSDCRRSLLDDRESIRRFLYERWAEIFRAEISIIFSDEDLYDRRNMFSETGGVNYQVDIHEASDVESFCHRISELLESPDRLKSEARLVFSYATHYMR